MQMNLVLLFRKILILNVRANVEVFRIGRLKTFSCMFRIIIIIIFSFCMTPCITLLHWLKSGKVSIDVYQNLLIKLYYSPI